jgi:hypothetical protein
MPTKPEPDFELAPFLHLPANTFAFLEWCTGVLRINLTTNEYKQRLNHPQQRAELEEFIHHERFHMLQIVTSGFLYHFTTELVKDILPFWKNALAENTKGRMLFYKTISTIPDLSPAVRKKFGALAQEDADGLSINALIEGAALFYQKTASYPPELIIDELRLATSYLPQEYTSAFRYASKHLETASILQHFAELTHLALCFQQPVAAFRYLVDALTNKEADLRASAQAFRQGGNLYLGTPFEVERFLYQREGYNPFFAHQVTQVIAHCNELKLSLFDLMAAPDLCHAYLSGPSFDLPMIFNPDEVIIPDALQSLNLKNATFTYRNVLVLTVLCLIIYRNTASGPALLRKASG